MRLWPTPPRKSRHPGKIWLLPKLGRRWEGQCALARWFYGVPELGSPNLGPRTREGPGPNIFLIANHLSPSPAVPEPNLSPGGICVVRNVFAVRGGGSESHLRRSATQESNVSGRLPRASKATSRQATPTGIRSQLLTPNPEGMVPQTTDTPPTSSA